MDKHMVLNLHEWETNKTIPQEIYKAFAQSGMLSLVMGFTTWPEKYILDKNGS